MATGRTNAVTGGPGAVLTVTLSNGASGATVTATNGTDTYSGTTNSSGVVAFTVAPGYDYTVSTSGASDKTVHVDADGASVTLNFSWYVIARRDTTNSDPTSSITYPQSVTINGKTYANSCYGFTKASGTGANCLGSGWANHELVSMIKPVKSDGGTTPTFEDAPLNPANWTSGAEYFTQIDAFWYAIYTSGNYQYYMITNAVENPDNSVWCKYAFLDADGSTIKNCTHIGCFEASGSTSAIYSKNGQSPLVSTALIQYFKGANARGGKYDCLSHQQLDMLKVLFVIIYGSLNSQTAHSRGVADASALNTANSGLSCTNNFGMAGSSSSGRNAFFWIHDLWGNMYQFIGGLFVRAGSTKELYYYLPRMAQSSAWDNGAWDDPTNTSKRAKQTSLGTSTGKTSTASGSYIDTICGNNAGGFAPISTSGSSSTYFADYGSVYVDSSRAYFPGVGGGYDNGDYAGLFHCYVYNNSTGSASYCGSRLSYRGGS